MDFQQLIKERRSVRAYKEKAVPHELLVKIVKDAQQAPSWANLQASRTYVIEDREKVEEFRRAALPEGNAKRTMNSALIVTTFVKDTVAFRDGKPMTELGNIWGAYDLGLHDAYLVLAASDLGLDTLIMGIRYPDAIREYLSIPEEEVIVSVIAVGYRDEEPVMRPRKPVDEVVKFI